MNKIVCNCLECQYCWMNSCQCFDVYIVDGECSSYRPECEEESEDKEQ